MKKWWVFGCIFMLVIICGCAPQEKRSESFALNTICTQQVCGEHADQAMRDVNELLSRITRELSIYEGSYIFQVNNAAPEGTEVSHEAAQLIQTAKEIATQTGGAFDPTIGAVSTLWDITGSPRVPREDELRAALPLVDYTGIHVDGDTVSLARSGMMIDLGGIAKGYAADAAVALYKQHDIDSALLNLGGNICVFGEKEDGWRIGLKDPLGGEGEYAAVITVQNTSVVTSGVYERFFESGGKRYHHLFDPQTGYPADNGLLAVTVVCESSTLADALSTALFVMGPEKGLAFAEQTNGIDAVFITTERRITATSGLAGKIKVTNEAYTLQS